MACGFSNIQTILLVNKQFFFFYFFLSGGINQTNNGCANLMGKKSLDSGAMNLKSNTIRYFIKEEYLVFNFI